MNARWNIGLAFLVIVMISPAIPGRMPALGISREQNSPMEMPPLSRLIALATPTPTPKPTPTPTPQPTSQSVQVFDLNEIYYFGGSGLVNICRPWEDVKDGYPAGTKLPIVTYTVIFDIHRLCAYGFPPDKPATIELYAPNGGRTVTFTHPRTKLPSALYGRIIPLDMPNGLPSGTWTVVVRGGKQMAMNTFVHPPKDDETIDVTHLLPRDVLRPDDPRWYAPFKQGDQAAIYAAGYAADSEVLVAVARYPENGASNKFIPVIAWKARANSLGHLHLQFAIDSSYKDGDYRVFAKPYTDKPEEVGRWTPAKFRVFSAWRACKGAPLSNLRAGNRARLVAGPPNNVRNRPRLSGRRIGQIQAYQNVRVEDGPKCNDGLTWWYVEVYDSYWNELNLEGWTAEGDASGYWLLPIE